MADKSKQESIVTGFSGATGVPQNGVSITQIGNTMAQNRRLANKLQIAFAIKAATAAEAEAAKTKVINTSARVPSRSV